MLKFVFWALLALNAVWFALGQGYLGSFKTEEHEPARLKNQVGADQLVLLGAAQAQQALAAAVTRADSTPAPAAAVAAAPTPAGVCLDVGTFREAEARRFEARLAKLDLGARLVRRDVEAQDITSYIVFIPPQGSKEAAEKKAAELKSLNVENYFIMNGDSPMKFAISLGVFKSETAAQALLATLNKQGVHSAKMAGRGPKTTQLAYQLRGLDGPAQARVGRILASFPGQQAGPCK